VDLLAADWLDGLNLCHPRHPRPEFVSSAPSAANFMMLVVSSVAISEVLELVLLPGIGHVPHLEAPDSFYKALLKFLKA